MKNNNISCLSYNLNDSQNSEFIEGEVMTETPEECERLEKLLISMLKVKYFLSSFISINSYNFFIFSMIFFFNFDNFIFVYEYILS